MLHGLVEDMPLLISGLLGQGQKGPFCKTMVSTHYLEKYFHGAIIFHMLIGFGDAMTSYDFRFTRLKVKVTRVSCKKYVHMLSDHYLENYLSHSFHISHADWS